MPEVQTQPHQKIIVWKGIINDIIIGVYFFEENLKLCAISADITDVIPVLANVIPNSNN